MKTSLITTILNEENSIQGFLKSVEDQTQLPDEVIIVDGGSTDRTLEKIHKYLANVKNKKKFSMYEKKGNRSIGRNEAVRRSTGDVILITDAGCLLDKDWVKEITKLFKDASIDVAAGYYKGRAETVFQKCLIPYVLVMPNKINPSSFLPATRSMAIRRKVFQELRGFDERYSHNEDYVFAKRMQRENKKIVFTREAIVYWIPRRTFKEAFIMFRRFAYGDIEAGIMRPKVMLLFLRYIIFFLLLSTVVILSSLPLFLLLVLFSLLYLIWAVSKNYKYVREMGAFYYLPLIQLTADMAVMYGSLLAFSAKFAQ